MSRLPAPRKDYMREAQTLQRIALTVQNDTARTPEWRRLQMERLTAVIAAFNSDAVSNGNHPKR